MKYLCTNLVPPNGTNSIHKYRSANYLGLFETPYTLNNINSELL